MKERNFPRDLFARTARGCYVSISSASVPYKKEKVLLNVLRAQFSLPHFFLRYHAISCNQLKTFWTVRDLQEGPSGRGTLFVDIKFKVPSLLIIKRNSQFEVNKWAALYIISFKILFVGCST